MPEEITSTKELAEAEWDGREPGEVAAKISATDQPTGSPFEFHVQMRSFTMREMDNLVIEAAARLIVGHRRDEAIAKAIEAKCIELIDRKATEALSKVTTEIIDAPLIPGFGDKKPVTMREFIGLYGREFLTAKVDREGNPASSGGYGSEYSPRIEYLVRRYMDGAFKSEIEKASNAAIVAIRREVKAKYDAVLAAEQRRLRDALNVIDKG